MDTGAVKDLVDDLSEDISQLETSLTPLINEALAASTSKLPLLDKAKLYVLATYAIESILFSYLRLSGVDAKNHPVFQELARVKAYFAKIKTAESAGANSSSTGVRLNKSAAERFIKHDLAGNAQYDRERAQREGRDGGATKRKLDQVASGTYTRLDDVEKRLKGLPEQETVTVVKADDIGSSDDDDGAVDATEQPGSSKAPSGDADTFGLREQKRFFKAAFRESKGDRSQFEAYIANAGRSLTLEQRVLMERIWRRKHANLIKQEEKERADRERKMNGGKKKVRVRGSSRAGPNIAGDNRPQPPNEPAILQDASALADT